MVPAFKELTVRWRRWARYPEHKRKTATWCHVAEPGLRSRVTGSSTSCLPSQLLSIEPEFENSPQVNLRYILIKECIRGSLSLGFLEGPLLYWYLWTYRNSKVQLLGKPLYLTERATDMCQGPGLRKMEEKFNLRTGKGGRVHRTM